MEKKVFFFLLLFFSFTLCFSQPSIKQVDPFAKVLKEDANVPAYANIHPVAIGDVLTVQFVLTSNRKQEGISLDFSSATIPQAELNKINRFKIGYVKVSPVIISPASDKIVSRSQQYPDPLFNARTFDITSDIPVPILIELPITTGIKPGIHKITVSCVDNKGKSTSSSFFEVEVFDVALPKTKFNYVNWYHEFDYKILNGGKEVKDFSPEYWSQFKKIVQTCKDYGQNMFTVNPMFLIKFKKNKQGIEADYTHFDKAVDIILKEVKMDYVLARQFAARKGGWESQFAMQIPTFYSETEYMMSTEMLNDVRVSKFYNTFLISYYSHLKSKNYLSQFLQHLADEPIDVNESSYKEIATYVRSKTPGLKIIEAVNNANLVSYIDILVVQLGELSFRYDEVIKKVKSQPGKQIWLYTGNHPQGNFANRFIELPLIKTRLLPWIAFRYNLSGYLHWGLNLWGSKPFEDASKIRSNQLIELPGGDAYIVYPGDQSLMLSTRFLEMRNALNDIRLLEMLKAKNPKAADRIVKEIIHGFDSYNTSTTYFFSKRKEILQLLGK